MGKLITLDLSRESTSLDEITPNDLALIEQQSELRVLNLETEVKALVAEAPAIKAAVLELQVTDDASMQRMNKLWNSAKTKLTAVDKLTKPVRQFLDRLHSNACNIEKDAIADLKEAAKVCDQRMKAYELERKRASQEAAKISADAIRRANEEAARNAAVERAEKLAEAERLRAEGRLREARELAGTPTPAPVVMLPVQVVPQTAPKLVGTTTKWPYTAKVVDKMAIFRAIADGRIPLTYTARGKEEDLVEINEALLKALAKQRQEDLGIPGAIAEPEPQFSRSRG